jgi:hypothetical protein
MHHADRRIERRGSWSCGVALAIVQYAGAAAVPVSAGQCR